MDNACRTQSNNMFNTVQTLTGTQLGNYGKATHDDYNAEYAAWLATPRGVEFKASAGDPAMSRRHAFFLSSDTVISPGRLERPYYTGAGGDGAAGAAPVAPAPPTAPFLAQATGLGCLPSEVQGQFLTPANKLRVLNCLIFATSHEFWVADENGDRQADSLNTDTATWGWIGTEDWDWECTDPGLEGPVPSCLKHDVMYSGLQKFAGASPGTADGNELDAAWNPRNKALADAKFRKDIAKYGCQNERWICQTSASAVQATSPLWSSCQSRSGRADHRRARAGPPSRGRPPRIYHRTYWSARPFGLQQSFIFAVPEALYPPCRSRRILR